MILCWKRDWRELPRTCGGNVEVWDQTVGCPDCGMNLWYLPQRDQWPAWDMDNAPSENHWADWKADMKAFNPYDVFMTLFTKIHPFQFNDCHDPGDSEME